MASAQTIIVGGGVAALSPFTLGALTKVAATNPPGINDSVVFQRTHGVASVVTVNNNDYTTATEALQITDGLISDTGVTGGIAHGNFIGGQGAAAPQVANAKCVVIGSGASSLPSGNASFNNVVIGNNAQIQGNAGNCILIGDSAVHQSTDPAYGAAVMIGSSTTWGTAALGFSGVGIGCGASMLGIGVAIGNGAVIANTTNYVAIGRLTKVTNIGQTLYGDNCQGVAGHTNAMAFGRNAVTLAANSLVFGAVNVGIDTVLVGQGDSQVGGQAVLYRHTNGSGNNDPTGHVTWRPGLSTGNAAGGDLLISTGEKAASGAGVQTATERVRVKGGLDGAAGAVAILKLSNMGSDAAAAAAGTLLNAPTAGNPVWIRVNLNGVEGAVPWWAV